MRIFGSLFTSSKNWQARALQREPVPFQQLLPLELKNTVSGKSDRSNDPVCLQEMAVMFACFKKNEFDQAKCSSEVTSFQKCYTNYKTTTEQSKKQARKGILIPGEKKLAHRQLNKLLKGFPAKSQFYKPIGSP